MASQADPRRQLGEAQHLCDLHGAYSAREYIPNHWTRCPACTAAIDAEQRSREERAEAARREQRRLERLREAGIPARYLGSTFTDFETATPAQRHAHTVSLDFVRGFHDRLTDGRGLVYAGLVGTGKTLLAVAIAQALLDAHEVRYTTAAALVRAVRGTWARDAEQTEAQLLRYLETLDLLVIDELGVQMATENSQAILFEVLDRRYLALRPTVLCTNEDQMGLRQFVGDRAFDRLRETSTWVPFTWPSYRARAGRTAPQAIGGSAA